MTTPVIFKLCEGEVTAVFPQEPGSSDPYTVTVYAHVGQHGIGSVGWASSAKPATPEQYADLLRELKAIGYDDLVIRKRLTSADLKVRRAKLVRHA